MHKLLQKVLDYLFLLRIPLLAPVWTILILGWISGNQHACIGGSWVCENAGNSIANLWAILIGFSFITASIYVVNQIVDIESDRINRKLFLLPNGIISVRTAWIFAFLCAVTGLVISFFYDIILSALFILGLLLGYFYNLPPVHLKNRAWGGVLANSLGHGMVTFLVGWYASKIGNPQISIDLQLLGKGLLSSVAPALANGAVFLATTIPDAEGDQLTGKKTFCVRYGEKTTAVSAALFCFGALAFSFYIENNLWVMAVPSLISLLFFVSFAFLTKRDMAFKAFKWPVFLLSFSVALFVPEYGILILITFIGSRAYYQKRFGIEYPTFKSK